MIIKPKYPKKVLNNPFYSGIIIGFLIATGFNLCYFVNNEYTALYGIGLLTMGIIYYFRKHKEYNED